MDGSSWFKQAKASARARALRLGLVALCATVGGFAACVGPISDFPFSDDDDRPSDGNGDDNGGAAGDGDGASEPPDGMQDAGVDSGISEVHALDAGLNDAGLNDAGCIGGDGGTADDDSGLPACEQGDASF